MTEPPVHAAVPGRTDADLAAALAVDHFGQRVVGSRCDRPVIEPRGVALAGVPEGHRPGRVPRVARPRVLETAKESGPRLQPPQLRRENSHIPSCTVTDFEEPLLGYLGCGLPARTGTVSLAGLSVHLVRTLCSVACQEHRVLMQLRKGGLL